MWNSFKNGKSKGLVREELANVFKIKVFFGWKSNFKNWLKLNLNFLKNLIKGNVNF